VFGSQRVAIFVDGCFWHGCPVHATRPKANSAWWLAKLDANWKRDRDTDLRLTEAGWQVIRVWEHELPADASARILRALQRRQHRPL
jgi:DNA mismatch endonuclease (patch repair protein)